jgi:H+/Cl- antiporter ClcA
VVTALLALYLNIFVLIVQLFQKVPTLKALAPNQSEPPFQIAQLATLALFIVITVLAVRRFRPNIS